MDKKLIVKWYECLDSTNTQAHRELSEASEGTVWVADYQTAGRGQRGNSWESGSGQNLLFTLLLRPEFLEVSKQFAISQIIALAIVNYLKTKGLNSKIKWPNDIYVGDKKICGILIEHTISGANLSASILGVGVNVNQMTFNSDAPNPVSMRLLLKEPMEIERKQVLAGIMQQLFLLYESLYESSDSADRVLSVEGLAKINSDYHSSLYRLGEVREFLEVSGDVKNKISAKIIGINNLGCLLLEKSDGTLAEYTFQQIRYII